MNTKSGKTALVLAALLTLLLVGGCSGSGGGDAGVADTSGLAAGSPDGVAADESARSAGGSDAGGGEAEQAATELRNPAVISTGTVSLGSKDPARARFEVQRIVDQFRGTVAEEETITSDGGEVEMARLVLRVPSGSFGDVMTALEKTGELLSTTSGSEDVTTQVIDNEVRIRAQTKSLERIEALLARAKDLQEIVAIEAQLTRRQADLDSLKSQQAWLEDQTSQATITVHIERTAKDDEPDETGFLSGLENGWSGLLATLSGLATALGLVLPFVGLLVLAGVPVWLLARAVVRRRAPVSAPAADAE